MNGLYKNKGSYISALNRRLMELVLHKRVDLTPLLTHSFSLSEITDAYDLFGNQRDGVLKVAVYPQETRPLKPGDDQC